jgi:hypothetical protein
LPPVHDPINECIIGHGCRCTSKKNKEPQYCLQHFIVVAYIEAAPSGGASFASGILRNTCAIEGCSDTWLEERVALHFFYAFLKLNKVLELTDQALSCTITLPYQACK